MHAIIRQGDGKYYVSAVFGYFRDITATDDYERYIQSIRNPYWIVLDEEKKLGNIREILPRHSELIRPAVANVDQALIIFAIVKPQPNFNLLDRFLVMMQQQDIPCIICFNKQDIDEQGIDGKLH